MDPLPGPVSTPAPIQHVSQEAAPFSLWRSGMTCPRQTMKIYNILLYILLDLGSSWVYIVYLLYWKANLILEYSRNVIEYFKTLWNI